MSDSTCHRCGAVPSGADFCAGCGEYVAWERPDGSAPTGAPDRGRPATPVHLRAAAGRVLALAAPATPASRTTLAPGMTPSDGGLPAPSPRHSTAVIVLPEEDANDERLSVQPAHEIAFKALVRNQSDIVDCYTLAVSGFETWWTIEPPKVYLLPFDAGEGYEQTVTVRLRPPRSPAASAGSWPIALTAESEAHKALVTSVASAVEIAPFDEIELKAEPERASGRRSASLRLTVANRCNHELAVRVSAIVKDDACSVNLPAENASVPAGGQVHTEVELNARRPMLVGRPEDHELTFHATPAATPSTAVPRSPGRPSSEAEPDRKAWRPLTAVFRQRAWLPWWSALVALALLAAAGLLAKAYFERVSVPDVLGHGISPARDELAAAGVKGEEVPAPAPGGPVATKAHHPPVQIQIGEVFKEIPAVGSKVAPGSKVKLYTATKVGPARVPELYDLPAEAAENRLSRVGFAIGDIEPYPPPKGAVVVAQTPHAGAIAEPDTEVVDVTVGQVAVVPDVVGRIPAKAMQMLHALGLVLVSRRRPTPSELIATQTPAADEVVRVGAEVDVTLAKPAAPPPRKTPKQKAQTKAKSAIAALPALAVASSAAAAVSALAKAGLHAHRAFAISPTVPAGGLLRTEPAAGSKLRPGASVTLVVSAGFPEVAVDDGRRVLALDGVTGKSLATIAGGPEPAVEPSWSPDGGEVAYVSNGRVMLVAAHGASGPRALTPAGERFSSPTFPSISSAPAVIAAIRQLADGDQAICLLGAEHGAPSCIPEPGWKLGDSIGWSPAGTELLVAASRATPPAAVGLLRLTSRDPFSVRARSWRPNKQAATLTTPSLDGAGVLAGAFSPSGREIALVEDLAGFNSVALASPSDLGLVKATRLAQLTSVCAAQWRADGAELLVQTGVGKGAGEGNCASSPGVLYRVALAQPGALSFLARGVAHPSWQPIPGVE